MKGSWYTVGYAAAVGLVSAALLTAAAELLGPHETANRKAEEMRNILAVLGVPLAEGASARELVDVYEANVRQVQRGELTVYEYVPAGADQAAQSVAAPLAGPGLWGPIKGLIAMDPAMRTVRAVSFYEHEETPGLGAEISGRDFRRRFVGKSIVSADGRPGMRIAAGAREAPNGVDAISGATMTCQKVQEMLNKAIVKIVKERPGHD